MIGLNGSGDNSYYSLTHSLSLQPTDYYEHSVALDARPTNTPVVGGYVDLHDDNTLVRSLNGTYGPEIFADRAADYIRRHKSENGDAPMFLYVAMQNTHVPLEASHTKS